LCVCYTESDNGSDSDATTSVTDTLNRDDDDDDATTTGAPVAAVTTASGRPSLWPTAANTAATAARPTTGRTTTSAVTTAPLTPVANRAPPTAASLSPLPPQTPDVPYVDDATLLSLVLDANGIEREDYDSQAHLVTRLEMFQNARYRYIHM
jgi:hypothetical protein